MGKVGSSYFEIEDDPDYVPVKRTITMLGLGWAFDVWDDKRDSWKNRPTYQLEHAYREMKRRNKTKAFTGISTGSELVLSQKKVELERQEKSLETVDIPVSWGVKGLSKKVFYFSYDEDDENKED